MGQGPGKKDKLADKWRPRNRLLEEVNREAGLTRRTQEKRKAEAMCTRTREHSGLLRTRQNEKCKQGLKGERTRERHSCKQIHTPQRCLVFEANQGRDRRKQTTTTPLYPEDLATLRWH